jgi:hypothetical protein
VTAALALSYPALPRRTRMTAMVPLKAVVKNGRIVVDEPTELPEGTEIELVPVGLLARRTDMSYRN